MARGCTPGLVRRWSWYVFPDPDSEDFERPPPPVEGDIAVHPDTGSCYLVLAVKASARKGKGWYSIQMEGLGVGAADLDDEGTFPYGGLTHADIEAIRAIEHAESIGAL